MSSPQSKTTVHNLCLGKWALNVCASPSATKRNIIIIIWLISPHFPWDLLFWGRATESKEYWPDYSTEFALMLFLHRGSPAFCPVWVFFCFDPLWQCLLGAAHALTLKCSPPRARITSSHSSSTGLEQNLLVRMCGGDWLVSARRVENGIRVEKSLCWCVFIPGVSVLLAVNRWWNWSIPACMW